MKRGYEKELVVNSDGHIGHNPCISHCLLYAFGECTSKHESRCPDCDQLFDFLSHQTRKVYLNAQFKAALSELDSNGALFIADYKMRVLPQSARETKQDFFGKRGWTLHTILITTILNLWL
jgi:hypothetical protein